MGKGWIAALGLIVLTVGLGVADSGFVLDAQRIVAENPLVDEGSVSDILVSRWWQGEQGVQATLYRPVPMLWFAVLGRIGSGRSDPGVFHLGSLVLHVVCAIARYLLILLLLGKNRRRYFVAFLAALIPALHAVSMESVVCMVGAAELLTALFMTLSWCTFLAGLRKIGPKDGVLFLFLSAIFWFVALLSKETSVLFPIILLLQWWLEKRQGIESPRRGVIILTTVLFAASAGGWWIMRGHAIGGATIDFSRGPYAEFSTVERLRSALAVIGSQYLPASVFPFGLMPNLTHQDVPPPISWMNGPVLLGIMVLAAVLAATVLAFRRKSPVAILLAFAIVSFLPVSNILVGIGTVGGFRLLYSPLFGISAALTVSLILWRNTGLLKKVSLASWGVMAVVSAAASFPLIGAWRSPQTLADYAIDINPKSVWALHNKIAVTHTSGVGPSDFKQFVDDFDALDAIRGDLAKLPGQDRLDQDTRLICYKLYMQRASAEGTYATTLRDADDAMERVQRGIRASVRAEELGWGDVNLVFDARLNTFRLRLVTLERAIRSKDKQEEESLVVELETDLKILDELADERVTESRRLSFLFEAAHYALMRNKTDLVDYFVSRGMALSKTDPKLAAMRARRLFQEKNYVGAYAVLDAVVEAGKAGVEELYLQAELSRRVGKNNERLRLLQQALRLPPQNENEVQILKRIAKMLQGS